MSRSCPTDRVLQTGRARGAAIILFQLFLLACHRRPGYLVSVPEGLWNQEG
jgi:hypothetical protein